MPSLFVFIALVATVVVTPEARGVSVDTGAELRRRVLVLTDATPHEVLMSDEAGALVYEMPLQHLGMLVERRSLFEGPPSSTDLDGLRAVVLHQGSASAVELDLSWLDDWIVDQVLPRGSYCSTTSARSPQMMRAHSPPSDCDTRPSGSAIPSSCATHAMSRAVGLKMIRCTPSTTGICSMAFVGVRGFGRTRMAHRMC